VSAAASVTTTSSDASDVALSTTTLPESSTSVSPIAESRPESLAVSLAVSLVESVAVSLAVVLAESVAESVADSMPTSFAESGAMESGAGAASIAGPSDSFAVAHAVDVRTRNTQRESVRVMEGREP
jgi:hypothetical protein